MICTFKPNLFGVSLLIFNEKLASASQNPVTNHGFIFLLTSKTKCFHQAFQRHHELMYLSSTWDNLCKGSQKPQSWKS